MRLKRFLFIGVYHLCYIKNTGWTNGRVGRTLSLMRASRVEAERWDRILTINF